jgi:hypothetical protein
MGLFIKRKSRILFYNSRSKTLLQQVQDERGEENLDKVMIGEAL